jgi:hypothetical protein
MLNGFLIFRGLCHVSPSRRCLSDESPDIFGVLEGEKLVRGSRTRYNLRYREQQVVDSDSECRSRLKHSCLHPIVTTPPTNPSSDGAFEDWTVLSCLASHSIDTHIYALQGSPGSTSSPVCFYVSGFSATSCEPLCRTYLHLLQRPSDLSTEFYTTARLSIRFTTIYSWVYSNTTDWQTRMFGMSDLDGASSPTFVGDGVSLYTLRHSTWACILYAHTVPL